MNGANGSMNYPGGSELDVGTTMYYRMRASPQLAKLVIGRAAILNFPHMM